ncbi:MAG: ABC transporter permease, partial [Fimbriimonas ginsengisoli]|nr:ABC transporter permease [Fimbriimonas ginsengisoli]
GMTGGRGFMAIAMVTFGRWKPVGVFFASLLIGAAEAVQYVVQGGAVEVSAHLLIAVPYVLALAVLALTGKGSLAPKALGRPYRREW